MGNNFKIYNLGVKSYEHFTERLDEGLTLTKHLKKKIILEKGKVITFAPPNLTEERLLIFRAGFLNPPTPPTNVVALDNDSVNRWLTKVIKVFLSQSKHNYCLFEIADDYPQKNIITRYPFKNILFNGEPYYILDHYNDESTIKQAIIHNTSYYPLGMGIFTKIPNISSYFSDKDQVKNKEFFRIAAQNTQKIYIQVYDHEGYLLWEKIKNE